MEKHKMTLGVFTGSSMGKNPLYCESVQNLGSVMVERGWELVYGGGNVGLMGIISQAVYRAGGRVCGVIPKSIADEIPHKEIHQLEVKEDMHQRKARIYELASAFVALPGGIGTLDEIFEIFTWQQLGFHDKPVGIYNINGYFDGLLDFLKHSVDEGFVKELHLQNLIVDNQAERLLERLENESPRRGRKW